MHSINLATSPEFLKHAPRPPSFKSFLKGINTLCAADTALAVFTFSFL